MKFYEHPILGGHRCLLYTLSFLLTFSINHLISCMFSKERRPMNTLWNSSLHNYLHAFTELPKVKVRPRNQAKICGYEWSLLNSGYWESISLDFSSFDVWLAVWRTATTDQSTRDNERRNLIICKEIGFYLIGGRASKGHQVSCS